MVPVFGRSDVVKLTAEPFDSWCNSSIGVRISLRVSSLHLNGNEESLD